MGFKVFISALAVFVSLGCAYATDRPSPHDRSAAPYNNWKDFDDGLCKPPGQPAAGFTGNTISMPALLARALSVQPDFQSRDFSFMIAGAKGSSASATILTLMGAYRGFNNSEVSDLGKYYALPLATKLDPEAAALARDVFWTLREYLIHVVFNGGLERFAIDPNGGAMYHEDWRQILWKKFGDKGTPRPDERADWFLWHVANGENYQIGCKSVEADARSTDAQKELAAADGVGTQQGAAPTDLLQDTTTDDQIKHYVKRLAEEKAADGGDDRTKKKPDIGSAYPPSFWDRSTWHVSGERDDLALAAFGLADPLVTSPSFSVDPAGKSSKPDANSYNFVTQAAIGYTLLQRDCEYNAYPFTKCTTPYQLNLFGDAFYGSDKNAPKITGVDSPTIDRFGMGLNFAVRLDPDFGDDYERPTTVTHRWAILLQAIPEFVTDSHFEAKTAYFELRADLLGMPKVTCLGNGNAPYSMYGFKFHCGFAVIGDYAHNYRAGNQVSLYNNFFRMGGEVGAAITADPGFCDDGFCTLVTNRLGLNVWYKELADVSGNHATVHNFTAQLSYSILGNADSGKGVALTAKYTDGLEDITLYKLPTWSIGIKAGI